MALISLAQFSLLTVYECVAMFVYRLTLTKGNKTDGKKEKTKRATEIDASNLVWSRRVLLFTGILDRNQAYSHG